MFRFWDYFSASFKVICDKSAEYINYYRLPRKENAEHDDNISDYNHLLEIKKYMDEDTNKRILKKVGLYEEYTTFFGPPTHIIDNLYLGSAFNAACFYTLTNNDIKVVINMTKEISQYFPDDFTYLNYQLSDNNVHTIYEYLDEVFDKIKFYQRTVKGNILIHCFMGASRSACVVIYYLMKTKNMSFDEALEFIKTKRSIVNPTFRLTKDLAKSFLMESHMEIK